MHAASATRMLPPGSTVAILGGGQLGRMLAIAATKLGFKCRVYADGDDTPAFDVAVGTRGQFDDAERIRAFAQGADVLTYEFENIPHAAVSVLDDLVDIRPSTHVLAIAQDRLSEKQFMVDNGIAVPRFFAVDGPDSLAAGMAALGGDAILKTRRFGYDGKGQCRMTPDTDPAFAWAEIGQQPAIVEQCVPFSCEVSVLLVRDRTGAVHPYDVPRNVHRDGILRRSTVPSGLPTALEGAAVDIATRVAKSLNYIGLLAVEFFVVRDDQDPQAGQLLVNEIAPRVHNSGHWTMDACEADQFENHIRAICGWPIAPIHRLCDVEMTNLIGDEIDTWMALAAEPMARLHVYGKGEARPGRKMGHVNRLLTHTKLPD